MNLRNQKDNKQMRFYHLFPHLIQITQLNITQLRIPLKSLREVMFQDLKASNLLTHFSPTSHFYTPRKSQETIGFLALSGSIEMWHWTKMG